MSQFSFQYPWAFALLVLFVVCAKWCKERSRAIYFPHVSALLAKGAHKSSLLAWLKWVGIVAAVTALASPVLTTSFQNSKKQGRDIVLVLDTSGSMREVGFDPNDPFKSKFDVVKEVVSDFIQKRKNDRIGLVTFGNVAFIASPLTFEKPFLQKITQMQQLGIAGRNTAINDALVQAYRMLEKSKAKSKIVILLTDGMDNASKVSFDEVRAMAAKRDIKLYTIGIGMPGDYDARYLTALANAGHGEAFAAHDAQSLQQVYDEIDKLETSKLNAKKVVKRDYLYIYPLFLAILSLLLFVYMRTQKSL
jgi:Ca-activated chloride channel family protein